MPSRSNLYNIPIASSQPNKVIHMRSNPFNTPESSRPSMVMPTRSNLYNTPQSSEPTEQVDVSLFFRLSSLKQGNKVHLTNLHNKFPERAFLPSQIAYKFSITRSDLQAIFPESLVSPQTKEAIDTTLVYCNAASLKGESKSCPTPSKK